MFPGTEVPLIALVIAFISLLSTVFFGVRSIRREELISLEKKVTLLESQLKICLVDCEDCRKEREEYYARSITLMTELARRDHGII